MFWFVFDLYKSIFIELFKWKCAFFLNWEQAKVQLTLDIDASHTFKMIHNRHNFNFHFQVLVFSTFIFQSKKWNLDLGDPKITYIKSRLYCVKQINSLNALGKVAYSKMYKMCVKHCLTCQNIQILRKQVNKHYILCASKAKLFLAGKFLTDTVFILSAGRVNLASGLRSRGLVKKTWRKIKIKLLSSKILALVVYFSENHLRSKWQQLFTRPMGSFFN